MNVILQLAAQLAEVKRELRRKEKKLKKYSQVLGAKQHVRDTLRRHNIASESESEYKAQILFLCSKFYNHSSVMLAHNLMIFTLIAVWCTFKCCTFANILVFFTQFLHTEFCLMFILMGWIVHLL